MKIIEKSEKVALYEGALKGERGVLTLEPISSAHLIHRGKVEEIEKTRTKYTIQYGEVHAYLDLIGRSVNHSCDPNSIVTFSGDGTYEYVAIRNILKGEEVFFDYNLTEELFSNPFVCLCNARNCKKNIGH